MVHIKYRLKKVSKINFNKLCETIYLNACRKYPFLNENEKAYVAGCILSRFLENYEPNANVQNNVIAPSLTTGKGATGNLTQTGALIASKQASETLGTPVSPAQIQDTDNTLKNLGIDPGLLASTINARNNKSMSENNFIRSLEGLLSGNQPGSTREVSQATEYNNAAFNTLNSIASQIASNIPNGYTQGGTRFSSTTLRSVYK